MATPPSDETARLAFAGRVLLLGWFVFLAVAQVQVWRQGSDLLAFWTAGSFVAEGHAVDAYDAEAVIAWQKAQGFPGAYPFLSPPPFLAVVAPLGWLPYPLALAVWTAAGYAALAVSLRWLPRALFWVALAFPAGLLSAMAGQTGLLVTALMCAALGALPARPLWSGIFIGLMIIKPQLALLTPVALAAAGAWRAFAVAAATVGITLAGSVALFGWPTMAAFLESGDLLRGLYGRPELLPKIKSVYAVAVTYGAGAPAAMAAQALAAAFAAWAVWRVWRRTDDRLARGAILAAATPLAPPYLLLYDVVFLALPVVWLISEGLRRGFRAGERAGLAILYFLPIGALLAPHEAPIVPLWAAILTVAVLQRLEPRPASSAGGRG